MWRKTPVERATTTSTYDQNQQHAHNFVSLQSKNEKQFTMLYQSKLDRDAGYPPEIPGAAESEEVFWFVHAIIK